MARIIRLLEKKRGDRRTGSPLVGGLGEVLFFGILFLLGAISLTYLVTSHVLNVPASLYQPGFGFWLMVLVTASFTVIGGGGVVYTALHVGTSAERRSALVKRATDIELIGDAMASPRDHPTIPRDANLTNSPGIRLAYRLPVTHAGVWGFMASAVFFLVWNGVAAVLVTVAIRSHMAGQPDWFLTLFAIPFFVIGIWATYYFIQQILLATGIGPTVVEISDHPLRPGQAYQLFVSQAGRLNVKSLALFLQCEEHTTFRQGTDIRTDRCCIYRQWIFDQCDFRIEPGKMFEHECQLIMPSSVMHSFRSDHNEVQWMLVVRGVPKSWSPFERRFPVVVYPASDKQEKP